MAKQFLKNKADFDSVSENKIIIKNKDTFAFNNSSITFMDGAKNNIVFVDENVTIADSRIVFFGSNSIIFLSSNKHPFKISADIFSNSVLYVGFNNYLSGLIEISLSEEKNLIIGNDNLFARNISIRTSDAHYVFDIETQQPINVGKSVFIGDHTWIGQNVMILKGTQVGSGSIVGSGAVVPGKIIPSNESWAGNPAKQLKKGVFFLKNCIHTYNNYLRDTMLSRQDDITAFIFNKSEDTIDMQTFNDKLVAEKDVNKKLTMLTELNQNTNKNRFFQ